MAYTYKYLSAEAKQASADARKPSPTVVDDATLAAWEADHYAHSLNLADAKADSSLDADAKAERVKTATDAMVAIEAAIAKAKK